MQENYRDEKTVVFHGMALEALRSLPDSSVDSVVTDPPYALTELASSKVTDALRAWVTGDTEFIPSSGKGFMGMEWDKFVPPPALWAECFRVLKPGGFVLAFAGARTQDLMGMSIRLAGFDIKDGIGWVFSQGFPKSMNVAKETAKALEANPDNNNLNQDWSGAGTAMKPSFEPIIVAQKPIMAKNITSNIAEFGTGVFNIDATRVGSTERDSYGQPMGRWTPNFVLSHSEHCIQSGTTDDSFVRNRTEGWSGFGQEQKPRYTSEVIKFPVPVYDCVEGCAVSQLATESSTKPTVQQVTSKYFPAFLYHKKATKKEKPLLGDGSTHVSVKPLELMRWLVRLVTPVDGVVLDPFLGSGTTVEAARLEGRHSIGVEAFDSYLKLIAQRIQRS
jgi:DNA modification methylase